MVTCHRCSMHDVRMQYLAQIPHIRRKSTIVPPLVPTLVPSLKCPTLAAYQPLACMLQQFHLIVCACNKHTLSVPVLAAYLRLARTVMYPVYDRIFGDSPAKNTVYKLYIYGSNQPYAYQTRLERCK